MKTILCACDTMSTVMMEFEDGFHVTSRRRALRRAQGTCRKGRTNGQD